MFETLFQYPAIVARHRRDPFAEARERFLNHCASQGLARATLQHYAQELLVVAERIDITIGEAIGSSAIEAAAEGWAREQQQRQRVLRPALVVRTFRSDGHGLTALLETVASAKTQGKQFRGPIEVAAMRPADVDDGTRSQRRDRPEY
jgi:hypothetical protein